MAGTEWLIELVLVLLLSITLFHALRLERALRVLRRDRSTLDELIARFNKSTSEADASIARLHAAAEGAGRDLERRNAKAMSLKEDLVFLNERAERLADRLEAALHAARKDETPALADRISRGGSDEPHSQEARGKSKAERDLLRALKMSR